MAHEITSAPLRGVEACQDNLHYGVFDHGAQVWAYQPSGQHPVLWLSSTSAFTDELPVRGGVPLCFPWFGAGRSGELTPLHGFARLATWHQSDIKDTIEKDGRLLVEYTLDNSMLGHQVDFPYAFTAYLRVKFTPEYLGLVLEVTNDGDEPFTYENALHTYLAVGDVRRITISGLDSASYFDKVSGSNAVQSGDVTITAETDRVYASTGEVVVADPVLGRSLNISKSGSAHTVVWNPWADKAALAADIGDEWTRMICVEAANAFDQAVTLLPGQTHLMKQRIAVTCET